MDNLRRTPKRARVTSRPLQNASNENMQEEGFQRANESEGYDCAISGNLKRSKLPFKSRRRKRRSLGSNDEDEDDDFDDDENEDAEELLTCESMAELEKKRCLQMQEEERARQDKSVRTLLSNLPTFGTFTRVNKENAMEYSKSYGPLRTLQPTRRNTSGRCKTVKNDDMNILVRALRLKKRKDREERKRHRSETSSPSPSVSPRSASADQPHQSADNHDIDYSGTAKSGDVVAAKLPLSRGSPRRHVDANIADNRIGDSVESDKTVQNQASSPSSSAAPATTRAGEKVENAAQSQRNSESANQTK
mmetsp:Transcript_381/g.858  ORF Transcript_381/g.858 Transcript_381/m.858 type:complete len:306 (-) Transcript_381:3103-4020(-)